MIKFSKITLFILISSSALFAGICIALIDWDVVNSGTKGMIKELSLTFTFVVCGAALIPQYLKKLKEENNEKK